MSSEAFAGEFHTLFKEVKKISFLKPVTPGDELVINIIGIKSIGSEEKAVSFSLIDGNNSPYLKGVLVFGEVK